MRVQKLKLRVFGVLRNHSDENGMLELELESPVDVETCALADEESVLSPGARLHTLQNLALLPPVCGG